MKALIFIISLLIFMLGISSQEIISFDSRFYLFALEMWQDGPTWFPTTYHQPYPDYTAASTFMIYLSSMLFGGVSKFTAVLPTAIAASLTVVFTYQIAALRDKRWGFAAACFMMLTITFFKSARAIALDIYPALFTTICFYLVYSADQLRKPARANWIYFFITLSFIFRGPIGLVLPVGVVCAYYLSQQEWKRFFITGCLSLLILMAGSVSLAALAYHVGGAEFLQDVLRMQVVGRIGENHLPFYFYFTSGLGNYALSFPFAVVIFIALLLRTPRDNKLFPFIAWMLVILVGMSIPGEKKTRYILAAVPAFSLIASYPFMDKISIRNFKLLMATVVMFVITMFTVVEPLELKRDSAKEFVVMIETKRKAANADLVFYRQHHDGMPIKYLINMPKEEMPVFLDSEKDLLNYNSKAFFIMRDENFEELPERVRGKFRIIGAGSVGHVKVVVVVAHLDSPHPGPLPQPPA